MTPVWRWTPAAMLGLAALVTVGIDVQRSLPLRMPLAQALSDPIPGWTGTDVVLSDAEAEVAGMDSYLLRMYAVADTASATDSAGATLYVGYYERQMQGRTIHSPKNCLPGSGWSALQAGEVTLQTPLGPETVNRYLLKNGRQTALVLYWYQGRGRVAANEYGVKLDLLRDAALRRRSEEALVRIVVPVEGDEARALETASVLARAVIPALANALPN